MIKFIFLFFCLPILSFAEGIEIMYQIEFEHNNISHSGYIVGGYSTDEIDSIYLNDDKQFEQSVKNWDRNSKNLEVYSLLIDWTKVKQKVSFPLQPYEMGEEMHTYDINEVKNLHLIKIWKRSDYHIKVLSPIIPNDTTWYSKPFTISKPIGDEVGCRLEVYSFGNQSENKDLIKKFTKVYLNPKENDSSYINYRKRLLALLYINKVIVVELCGC